MLLIHLLTFDRDWFNTPANQQHQILFFDGKCAFCNGIIRFSLSEDIRQQLRFSPLQGEIFKGLDLNRPQHDSIVLYDVNDGARYKSDAAIQCLRALGGIWYVLGNLIILFPKWIRDAVYDAVGRIRYRLAGQVDVDTCRLLPKEYAAKVLF